MIITDLLGAKVFGPEFVGFVSDVRFSFDAGNRAALYGILVSPHARSSSLGYERSDVRSPALIAALVRWRHRGTFLVRWEDIERFDPQKITLRTGFTKVSSQLP
jgi:hypothetical protein